jgi:hypothetical protein
LFQRALGGHRLTPRHDDGCPAHSGAIPLEAIPPRRKSIPTLIVNQPNRATERRQAKIGIVDAQK